MFSYCYFLYVFCSLLCSNYSFYVSIICFIIVSFLCMFCFLFCVLCVFVFFCVLFFLMYTVVSFLFVCKFTDHCHRMETQLQSINITSYQMTPHGCSSRLGCYVSSVGKELSTKKVSDLRKVFLCE